LLLQFFLWLLVLVLRCCCFHGWLHQRLAVRRERKPCPSAHPRSALRSGSAASVSARIRSLRLRPLACAPGSAGVRSRLTGYRTGTRASRKPMTWSRLVGATLTRYAARQRAPSSRQQPPRPSRYESLGKAAAHHCHTFPCISHKPNLFAGYAPTRVGRPRYFPFGKAPKGKLPLKFACSEDRSLVGVAK